MRPSLACAIALSFTLVIPTAANAQLQWQSSGVQQASHTVEAPPVPKATPVRMQAKAPRTNASRANATRAKTPRVVASRPVSPTVKHPAANKNHVNTQQIAKRNAAMLKQAAYVIPQTKPQPGVEQVCYSSACSSGCGVPVETTCGFPEPGCSVDVGCGLAMGEPCGCGDVGCVGTCGPQGGIGLGCDDRGAVPLVLYVPPIQELTFNVGVQAFKGPLDDGRDRGNFGIHEGFNIGGRMSWLPFPNLGYQVGYQATHSQLHGDASAATADAHTQQFATIGLFHRKPVGLQYGVVYDVLQDERQVNADFSQLRGQISITNPRGNEFGFTFMSHMNDTLINNTTFQAVDQYLLFYRMHGHDGGEFRFFGGVDSDSKGILGGDIDVPLNKRWSLQTGFTYLIPEEDNDGIGSTEEAWNIGTNLVWHYGSRAKRCYKGQFRPMFNVADNGSLMVDDRQ